MEAKDLMIGDWLYTKATERNVRVRGIRMDCENPAILADFGDTWWYIGTFDPIPITGEILEKNGFEKTNITQRTMEYRLCVDEGSEAYLFVNFRPRTGRVQVCYDPAGIFPKVGFSKYEMSVHDLQHAMRMCGIEKEVVL